MYQLSGMSFRLPCLVFGAFPLLLLFVFPLLRVPAVLPAASDIGAIEGASAAAAADKSFMGLLTSGAFVITTIGVVLGSSALGFIDPVLAPYMASTYGLDAGLAGVFFMIPGLVYILTAMVAGALVDSFGGAMAPRQEYRLKLTVSVGFGLLLIGYLFLAPAFAWPILQRLGVFAASLVALGIGIGLTVMPSNSDLQGIAERRMQPSEEAELAALTSQVAGVWGSAYAAGQAVGPTVGGVLDATIGVNWGCFAFAMICAFGALLNAYGAWRAEKPVHIAIE